MSQNMTYFQKNCRGVQVSQFCMLPFGKYWYLENVWNSQLKEKSTYFIYNKLCSKTPYKTSPHFKPWLQFEEKLIKPVRGEGLR